jgi:hemerythrin-like domain-containing protein
MKTNITAVMVNEHKLILRMIALLEERVALLEQNGYVNPDFFLDTADFIRTCADFIRTCADFIRTYADRFHHAKEEDVLFVELVKNGMPEKQSPVEAMLIEHEQGRAFVMAMDAAAVKVLEGVSGQIPVIVENARGYSELLRGHIIREDTILYPLAERILPEKVRDGMLDAYARAEQRTPGLEAKCRGLVEAYEARVSDRVRENMDTHKKLTREISRGC